MSLATPPPRLPSHGSALTLAEEMKAIALAVFVLVSCTIHAQEAGYNTGMPFGLIGPKEVDRLEAFAKNEGVDLMGDVRRASEKDEAALVRMFAFSLKFTKLDSNAKTYGQIVYSNCLNLSEAFGLDYFSRLVASQPEAVRQRIRDFLFYDGTQAPLKDREKVEEEARKDAPLLFPSDYVFGANDPIFKNG
jgi:hypothetical protein